MFGIGKFRFESYWDWFDWDWDWCFDKEFIYYDFMFTLWHPFGHINILWKNNIPTPW